MQSILFGKKKKNEIYRNMNFVCFERVRQKNSKKRENDRIQENKTTSRKMCLLSAFENLMYQNDKMDAKHSLWRRRITLPKTSFLGTKALKFMNSTLHEETKQHYQNVYFRFLSNSQIPNRQNSYKIPLIGDMKWHYYNRAFRVLLFCVLGRKNAKQHPICEYKSLPKT